MAHSIPVITLLIMFSSCTWNFPYNTCYIALNCMTIHPDNSFQRSCASNDLDIHTYIIWWFPPAHTRQVVWNRYLELSWGGLFVMITVIVVTGDMERLMRARNCQDHLSYLDLKVIIQGIVTWKKRDWVLERNVIAHIFHRKIILAFILL